MLLHCSLSVSVCHPYLTFAALHILRRQQVCRPKEGEKVKI